MFLCNHCPCVTSRSFMIKPDIHLSTLIGDPINTNNVIGTLLNHELSLIPTLFDRTMLQGMRTFNDARRTRTFLHCHQLLTCLDLSCFKDPVEFSTACTIPTCFLPRRHLCATAPFQWWRVMHTYPIHIHISKLTLGKLVHVSESNPTDSSVDTMTYSLHFHFRS